MLTLEQKLGAGQIEEVMKQVQSCRENFNVKSTLQYQERIQRMAKASISRA